MTLVLTQDEVIEKALLFAIDNNHGKDKTEIFTIVEKGLNVPRPTIRRVKKELLLKLHEYIEVLS